MSATKLTGKALVAEYNRVAKILGEPPVKRFMTSGAGQRRLAALQKRLAADPVAQQVNDSHFAMPSGPLAADAAATDEYLAKLAESAEPVQTTEEQAAAGQSALDAALAGDGEALAAALHTLSETVPEGTVMVVATTTNMVPELPAGVEQVVIEGEPGHPGLTALVATDPALVAQPTGSETADAVAAFVAAARAKEEAAAVASKAPPAASETKRRGRPSPTGETLVQQRDRYNALVDQALELGITARKCGGPTMKSTFESRASGDAAIAKLTAKIEEAKAKKEQPVAEPAV